MFTSLKRRDILILSTFWILTACVVGLLLVFFMIRLSQSDDLQQVRYEVKPGEVTALTLYPLAQEAALAWESDVQLLSASATWNHPSLAELEQPVEWVYRFYSPGLQRILFVIVTPEQQVISRPHLAKNRRELRVVDPASWQMDSPKAITVWLNQGSGGEWLQQSAERIVSAQLTRHLDRSTPVWTISGLNPETGQSVVYTVDAVEP